MPTKPKKQAPPEHPNSPRVVSPRAEMAAGARSPNAPFPDDRDPAASEAYTKHRSAEYSTKTTIVRNHPAGEKNIAPKPVPDREYTEYTPAHNASGRGFQTAKTLAKIAMANKGRLLKKRFVLESVLGQGGMGVVYKAKDLRKVEAEDINPFVATKVLNNDFRDHPHAFVALQQEAVKSQKLSHPNIVTVHDFDRDGDTIFITMELLQGRPLDQLLKKHRNTGFGKDNAIRIFRDLTAALSYAHERNIIHADFKPGNVFYTREKIAKVLDFGMAQAASKENAEHPFDAGQLGALTPTYASLEMLEGQPPEFSDDVYALACVFYEMLAGRHPYDRVPANRAFAKGMQPRRVESLSSHQWRALSRALALRRRDRTQTVREFALAFEPSRKKAAFGVAASVLLVATLATFGWSLYQREQTERELESEKQASIADNMAHARTCFEAGDYQCAQERSAVVLNLAPDHPQATALVERARAAEAEATREADITSQLRQAGECLRKDDIHCAKIFLANAAEIDPAHAGIAPLQWQIDRIVQGRAAKARLRGDRIAALIERGQQCFEQRDFDCAIASAEAVFALAPDHAGAVELKQNANIALERLAQARLQQERDRKTVEKIITQAQACFQAGNFTCAIAKSESALDFMPDNTLAKEMKRKAKNAQDALKRSITIN